MEEEIRAQWFYQSKPERDTPYRELVLEHDGQWGLRVCLFGGTKWRAKGDGTLMKQVLVKSIEAGEVEFNWMFRELCDSGWKPETPYQTWD